MIDEGPGSISGGQGNPIMSGGPGITSRQQQDEANQRAQYSIPGILHFLQTEWARFEMERSQWEVERAELQVEILIIIVPLSMLFVAHDFWVMSWWNCYHNARQRVCWQVLSSLLLSDILEIQNGGCTKQNCQKYMVLCILLRNNMT